jgi:hypothetical protein
MIGATLIPSRHNAISKTLILSRHNAISRTRNPRRGNVQRGQPDRSAVIATRFARTRLRTARAWAADSGHHIPFLSQHAMPSTGELLDQLRGHVDLKAEHGPSR